jgi:N4-gp56 family major capsid protein
MTMQYNDPAGGTPSSIGATQMKVFEWDRAAIIEAQEEEFFTQLADVTNMPKHAGKKIKKFWYIPLLDDRNVNDQGIDANGVTIANGNLYGSSKDIGTISGKLPVVGENGGRVNRVGYTRVEIEGTFNKFGFFDEYTRESMEFDSDDQLEMHIRREMVRGAAVISEDALQIDLINNAGVVRYPGSATQASEMDATSEVTYGDLMRLGIDLDNNRCARKVTAIYGSRMTDTRVISGGRAMYCGSELIPTLRAMKDLHNNPAYIEVKHYGSAGNVLRGEQGSVDQFRIIIVPRMLKWAGAGGDASATSTHYETNDKFDVFPMLVVGDKSFSTIGFQTDGKNSKFSIKHRKPGSEGSYTVDDPYGEKGFSSIKWHYGFFLQRSEWIGLIKTTARM